jgi:hypothetical protein
MYFANFPNIVYDSVGNDDFKIVTNLLRRISLRAKIREDILLFDRYDVREGETPEIIADKLYGDSELHWTILLLNNITNRYSQWPMSYTQFLSFLAEKYPFDSSLSTQLVDQTHHFEITQTSGDTTVKIDIGTVDTTSDLSATAVTNYEYEEKIQDDLRHIRLLDPSYLTQFISEFESIMKESVI